jgi:uncharacterized membrane protein
VQIWPAASPAPQQLEALTQRQTQQQQPQQQVVEVVVGWALVVVGCRLGGQVQVMMVLLLVCLEWMWSASDLVAC